MALSIDVLELMKPVAWTAPGLGTLSLDVHGAFQDWLSKGLDARRWPDGQSLLRDVLAEQVTTANGAAIETATLNELGAGELEELAASLFGLVRYALRPQWIERETYGRRRRGRKRRDTEAYDLSHRQGETECDHLYRLARDWREDSRLRDEEFTATTLGPNIDELIAAARRADELDAWSRAAGLLDDRRHLIDALDAARAFDPAATTVAAAMARVVDPYSLTSARNAVRDLGASAFISDQGLFREHMAAHKSFMEMAYPQARSITQEIDRLSRLNRPIYDAVSVVMAERASSVSALLGLDADGRRGDLVRALAEPRSYFDELRRHLHVDRPAAGLAGLAAASSSLDLRQVMDQVTALRPGYQIAAALALTGVVTRGVVVDLLRHYDLEPSPATSPFSTAVETAYLADGPLAGVDSVDALWARVFELEAEVSQSRDLLSRQGRLEIIGLIVALLSAMLAAAALGVQVADFRASEAERQSDAIEDQRRAAFETKLLNMQARTRVEAVERDRAVRFIASDGPVRAEPDARATVLQHVFAGQMARAKDQRGGWVLVEVFSYAPEQSITGWVSARRLRGRP